MKLRLNFYQESYILIIFSLINLHRYEANEVIIDSGEDVYEIYFILEGELKIGFEYEG